MDLKEFCKLRGTTLKRVAEKSGIPLSSAYTIASGKTPLNNVGISVFMRLASALGCTTDELYTALTEDVDIQENMHQLTPLEYELVDIYRNITPKGQQQLMLFARGCLSTFPKNNQLRGFEETA